MADPIISAPIDGGLGRVDLIPEAVATQLQALGYTVHPPGYVPPTPPVDPPIDPPPDPPPVLPPVTVPNPAPTLNHLSIRDGEDVDHAWKKSVTSFWCDHRSNFKHRRLVVDGRLLMPNPKQVEPKIFGAQSYLFDGLVVRNIASCFRGDMVPPGNDDVHTEGLYLGAAFDGQIRNSYWGFTDGNTAVAIFGTAFPGSNPSSRLVLHNIRLDVGGVEGDGKTYWEGPIWYTFQGKILNCVVRNAQVRRGASGGEGHFGNSPQAWPHGPAWGGSGWWEYDGSRTGGNSGKGFQWVEKDEPWPDFPDGDRTLPASLCNRGY